MKINVRDVDSGWLCREMGDKKLVIRGVLWTLMP